MEDLFSKLVYQFSNIKSFLIGSYGIVCQCSSIVGEHTIVTANLYLIKWYAFFRDDEYVVDVFNQSAKMSTYLLAFIICDFEYKELTTVNGVTVISRVPFIRPLYAETNACSYNIL